jgi:FAD/FMN-containing dehydrogenase
VIHLVGGFRRDFDSLDSAEMFFDDGAQLVSATFDVVIPFQSKAYILLDFSADADQTLSIHECLKRMNFSGPSAVADDEINRTKLWRLREEHTAAISTRGVPHKFDVTVAVSDLPEFIDAVRRRVFETNADWSVFVFGHAADGNMHVNVVGPSVNDESIDEIVLRVVADFNGSISAEHGIGSAKKKWLSLSRSQIEIETMKAIKGAIDPKGLMNPNALFES